VPIPLLHAHAVARTQCACQKFVLDQHGDHVLTCKKHTGAIVGHDHVIIVLVQLARNSGLRVRIIRKVATTAVDSNKQGDVQAMEFGIPGYDDLVWDVSLVCDRIGSSTQHGLNGTPELKLGDCLFCLLFPDETLKIRETVPDRRTRGLPLFREDPSSPQSSG